jgi:hypothetical protein
MRERLAESGCRILMVGLSCRRNLAAPAAPAGARFADEAARRRCAAGMSAERDDGRDLSG